MSIKEKTELFSKCFKTLTKTKELVSNSKAQIRDCCLNTKMTTVLLKDLLDLGQMENGKFYLNRRLCSVPDIFEATKVALKQRLENKNIQLVVEDYSASSEFLCRVFLDSDRMNQVITNLVSNAIKFSESGATIKLSAKTTNMAGVDFEHNQDESRHKELREFQ